MMLAWILVSNAPAAQLQLTKRAPLLYAYAWVDGRPVGNVRGKKAPTFVNVDPGPHEIWYASDESGTETLCHGMIEVGEAATEAPLSFSMMEGVVCPGLTDGLPAGPTAFKGVEVTITSETDLRVEVDNGAAKAEGNSVQLNLSPEPHPVVVYFENSSRVIDQFMVQLDPGRRLAVTCTYKGCIGQQSAGTAMPGFTEQTQLNDGTAEPMETGSASSGAAGTASGGAALLAMAKQEEGGLWGYINPVGEFVIQPRYERCEQFTEDGFASVRQDDDHVFIGADGQPLQTDVRNFSLMSVMGFGVLGFREGLAPVGVRGRWGFIDTTGKLVIPTQYDWVSRFDQGIAAAKRGREFFVLNREGGETPVTADGIIEIRKFREHRAPYRTKKKRFGFVDESGKAAIPATFLAVGHFSEGRAWAKGPDKKVGFIDASGTWVIQPTYVAAKDFSDGLARVKAVDGTWLFVTVDGTEKRPSDASGFKDFSDGLALAKSGSLWGLMDTSFEWAVSPRFERLRPFSNGYAAARSGESWGVIDRTGEWVVQPRFNQIKEFYPTGVEATE